MPDSEKIKIAREIVMDFLTTREAALGISTPINGYQAEALAKAILVATGSIQPVIDVAKLGNTA